MASYHDQLRTSRDDSVRPARWLTVSEIARILALSPRTVRRLIHSGQIEAVTTSAIRGRMRVSPEALEDFLQRASVTANEGQ